MSVDSGEAAPGPGFLKEEVALSLSLSSCARMACDVVATGLLKSHYPNTQANANS